MESSDLTLPCLVHDLNNVLQTVVEAAELLSTDPRWAALSAAILRSAERGKSLTASIESAEETAAPLETILDNAIAFVEDSTIAGRGPKIRFERQIEPGIVLRRNWAWERVLINLFSNAVSAMPGGGAIYIRASRSGGRVEIVVRDEGPGIAPEILEDVFNPHVSTRGSGLGLHIVWTIVRQEDGEVRAANRADRQGAEFTIIVPAEPIISAHSARA